MLHLPSASSCSTGYVGCTASSSPGSNIEVSGRKTHGNAVRKATSNSHTYTPGVLRSASSSRRTTHTHRCSPSRPPPQKNPTITRTHPALLPSPRSRRLSSVLLSRRKSICFASTTDPSPGNQGRGCRHRRSNVRHQRRLRRASPATVGFQLRWRRDFVDVRVSRPVVLELHRAERATGGLADGGKATLLLAHRIFQPPGKPAPST